MDIIQIEKIKAYCLSKRGAYEDHPFGEIPVCFKLNGKIFAQLYPDMITLKCTVDAAEFYRNMYPEKVVRGYHCPPVQQPYWNTVYMEGFPQDELVNMIDEAYNTVFNSFSKKIQRDLYKNL